MLESNYQRYNRGMVGPSPGSTSFLILDDLHVPHVRSGAQEFVRQVLSTRGWYSHKDGNFVALLLTTLVGTTCTWPHRDFSFPEDTTYPRVSPRLKHHVAWVPLHSMRPDSLNAVLQQVVARAWDSCGRLEGAQGVLSAAAGLAAAVHVWV